MVVRSYLLTLLVLTGVFGMMLSSAYATIPLADQEVILVSKDYRFIDEIYIEAAGKSRDVNAWLIMPDQERYPPPYPAVVFLHSSWGLSKQERYYADLFAELGVASILIDSFRARGVRRTSKDQSLVATSSMMADAFAALDYLSLDVRFQSDKVGVMGFSKGAICRFIHFNTKCAAGDDGSRR